MNVLQHQFWATPVVYSPAPRWHGKFSAPGLGVGFVRDAEGFAIRFESEEQAMRAASVALVVALNAGRRPRSPTAITFRPIGQGRARRFAPIGR